MTTYKIPLKISLLAAIPLLLQVMLFDNLTISIYTYIPAYLLFPLSLPKKTRSDVVMLGCFAYGWLADLLSGSGGSITIALTTMGALRNIVERWVFAYKNSNPLDMITTHNVGRINYLLYTAVLIIIFNITIIFVESFGHIDLMHCALKAAISTVLTIPAIYLLQFFVFDNLE